MSRYEIGERAEADLNEIWTYIAQHDPQATDRQIDRLFERFEMLGRQPTIGELWGNNSPSLRVFPVGKFAVFYAIEDDTVQIRRVLHGARDLSQFVGSDE